MIWQLVLRKDSNLYIGNCGICQILLVTAMNLLRSYNAGLTVNTLDTINTFHSLYQCGRSLVT